MPFIRSHKVALAVFALGLLARFLFLGLALHMHQGQFLETISGADCYFEISQNLVAGHGYSCDVEAPYTLNSIRPPVQPFFLASLYLVVHSYWLPLVVQIIVGSCIPLLSIWLASYITPNIKIASWVGVLLALEPNSILFSIIFYSETVFTLLLLMGVVCIFHFLKTEKIQFIWASGFLLGLATLTKPTAEYIPLLCIAAVLGQYKHKLNSALLPIGMFVFIFLLTISPWVYRNYEVFGVAGVSPQLGEQLYAVLVPSVLSFEKGTTFGAEFTNILTQGGGVDPSSASIKDGGQYIGKAIPILLAHPRALVIVSANTALNFFIHDGMIEVLKHVGVRPEKKLGSPALFLLFSNPAKLFRYIGTVLLSPLILILIGRVVWVGVTILSFVGFVRYIRHESRIVYAALAASIVLYFMLTTLVIGLAVTARYRLPVEAFILLFAVYEVAVVGALVRIKGVRFELSKSI